MHMHFVTGGTGFIGRHLIAALLQKGSCVHMLVRPYPHRNENSIRQMFGDLSTDRLTIVSGDLTKQNLGLTHKYRQTLLIHQVTVWHLGANLSFDKQIRDQVAHTNIDGTRHIMDFANKYASELQYMSTIYVCGNKKKLFTEDMLDVGQQFHNTYEESKYEAEKLVRATATIPVRIFRPSIVIGHAYEGKAAGCTFGYYRYTFLFNILRYWVIAALQKNAFVSRILQMCGTNYDNHTKRLHLPWLLMPYPHSASVDLVPVDYIVDRMLEIGILPESAGKTFHLTNSAPSSYRFFLEAVMEDFDITGTKFISVPNHLFPFLFTLGYLLLPKLRRYITSLRWYLPYITDKHIFSRTNTCQFETTPMVPLSRETMKKINQYAKQEIFSKIDFHSEN